MSTAIASYSLLVMGVLMIAGGVMGFKKSNSKASLIAGSISGAIYVATFIIGTGNPQVAAMIGAALSLVLAVMFAVRLKKSGKFMPAGMLLVLSLAESILLIVTMTARQ